MNPSVAADKLIAEHAGEIKDFLISMGITHDDYFQVPPDKADMGLRLRTTADDKPEINIKNRAMREFMHGFGYLYTNAMGMGGSHRQIFTTTIPLDMMNKPYRVTGVSRVVTGEYYPPGGGYDRDGNYDYECGGLSEPKHHRILDLNTGTIHGELPGYQWNGFWIEDVHLEKLDA